jgi:hemerythrin
LYEISREVMKNNLRELKRETVEHFSSREDYSMSQLDIDKVVLECNRKLHEAKAM